MEKVRRIKTIMDRTLPEHIAVRATERAEIIDKNLMPYWRIKLTVDIASVEHALTISNGNLSLASDLLGISRNTIQKWVKDMGINAGDYFFDDWKPNSLELRKQFKLYEDFHRETRKSFYKEFKGALK